MSTCELLTPRRFEVLLAWQRAAKEDKESYLDWDFEPPRSPKVRVAGDLSHLAARTVEGDGELTSNSRKWEAMESWDYKRVLKWCCGEVAWAPQPPADLRHNLAATIAAKRISIRSILSMRHAELRAAGFSPRACDFLTESVSRTAVASLYDPKPPSADVVDLPESLDVEPADELKWILWNSGQRIEAFDACATIRDSTCLTLTQAALVFKALNDQKDAKKGGGVVADSGVVSEAMRIISTLSEPEAKKYLKIQKLIKKSSRKTARKGGDNPERGRPRYRAPNGMVRGFRSSSPEPDQFGFRGGDLVQVFGLTKAQRYNGRVGTICQQMNNLRYAVQLLKQAVRTPCESTALNDYQDHKVRVRPGNLRRVTDVRMVSASFWKLFSKRRALGKQTRFWIVKGDTPVPIRYRPHHESLQTGLARPGDVVFQVKQVYGWLLHFSGWLPLESLARVSVN